MPAEVNNFVRLVRHLEGHVAQLEGGCAIHTRRGARMGVVNQRTGRAFSADYKGHHVGSSMRGEASLGEIAAT